MTSATAHLPEAYVDRQLADLAAALAHDHYPDYPAQHERLVAHAEQLGRTATGALVIPEGSWSIHHPFALRSNNLRPDTLQVDNLRRDGYELDSLDRPLHPWFYQMLADPALGVVTGKGFYWSWGPNRTADSVVLHDDDILLIQRHDTGDWALPGGFINNHEHAAVAAKREAKEETGIDLERTWGIPIYKGPVVDPRMTAHAWPETTAFMFDIPSAQPKPEVRGSDDAATAQWIPLEQFQDLKLFGSHRFLAELALSQLGVASPRPIA